MYITLVFSFEHGAMKTLFTKERVFLRVLSSSSFTTISSFVDEEEGGSTINPIEHLTKTNRQILTLKR